MPPVQGRIGYVPSSITHLCHGSRADRRYLDHTRYLANNAFPAADLTLDESGLGHWASDKLEMHMPIAEYFSVPHRPPRRAACQCP